MPAPTPKVPPHVADPEANLESQGQDPLDDGDRPSVTDVNGTVARFEMTYSPPSGEKEKFGPPLRSRIPSAIYMLGALVLGGVVLYAYALAPSTSVVFGWVVEGDRGRPVSAGVLATVIVVSALGTVLRTHMRGVLLSEEWIEARYLLPLGIPRARRWGWPQVLRVVIDGTRVALELWDGSFERLPEVAKGRELVESIARHAHRLRIDVTVLAPPETAARAAMM
ncbi:MAG TPA: hypothetical protein VKU41_16705 [Polyangiaceae bacterium]|nr:hypothetical protein [Polyangiaceae bacterium]